MSPPSTSASPSWSWIRVPAAHQTGAMESEPELAAWAKHAMKRLANLVTATETSDGRPLLYGTLAIVPGSGDICGALLHFHVTSDRMVTLFPDSWADERLELAPWRGRFSRCENAPEALAVLLGLLAHHFHEELDGYEARLGELEEAIRSRNRKVLMEQLIDRRHELLNWRLRLAPFRELADAMEEAFLDELTQKQEYCRCRLQLKRIACLLEVYEQCLDRLLSTDEAISSFRGNEIMKTLTIFTVLFTPATVIGALWGMNFDLIPLSGWSHGFALGCSLIVLLTSLIYGWLWHKGWTGDLLRGSKPDSRL